MDKRPILFLPKSHLQAIGNLAAHWAYLEWMMEYAIWAALDVDEDRGRAVTTHAGMVSRAQMLIILIHEMHPKHPELCAPMEGLLARIDAARVQRNNIIHFIWKHSKAGAEITGVKFSAKGKLKAELQTFKASDIRAVTSEVYELVNEMMGLLEVMFPWRHFPWRKK